MAESRDGGIWREGLVAGLVTVIFIAFELFAHAWQLDWLMHGPNWWWALVLVVAFAVALVLVSLVKYLIHLLQTAKGRRPIKLKDIGDVNGYWIDAIRDHPDHGPIQVSIFELSSTEYNGFSANGTSYTAKDGYEFGEFKTTQSQSMPKGFMYFFEGKERQQGEGEGKLHEGVGYYAFSRVNDRPRVRGVFLAFNEISTRRLTGRMLTKTEWQDAQDETKRSQLIQKFLAEKPF